MLIWKKYLYKKNHKNTKNNYKKILQKRKKNQYYWTKIGVFYFLPISNATRML